MSKPLTIHHHPEPLADTSIPDPHQDAFSKNTLGFWMYLMTDCILFATLFTTYAVLHHETFGGPSSKDLFDLKTAFIETMVLLCSSVSYGLAMLSILRKKRIYHFFFWLGCAFLLGLSFVGIELHEFYGFVQEGNSWRKSAFLSGFFTLVGTHGLHVSTALFWMIVLMGETIWRGINPTTFRRLVIFGMFWHFLDLVWVFIFTLVYLVGVM